MGPYNQEREGGMREMCPCQNNVYIMPLTRKKKKHKVTLFSQHTSAGPFIIPIDESI